MARTWSTLGVVLVASVLQHCCTTHAQTTSDDSSQSDPTNGLPKAGTLENAVFTEMLRVVDEKFDSLSARISVLERSVNSLNFYSVRQFREITESMEIASESTEGLRKQISKMDADDRALKAAVSQVGRDINVIKKDISVIDVGMNDMRTDMKDMRGNVDTFRGNSEKMLDDIATSIVYLNEHTKEKNEEVRGLIQGVTERGSHRIRSQMKEDTALLIRSIQELGATAPSSPVNCTVNFRPLEQRVDQRFAELKRQTRTHFESLQLKAETTPNNHKQPLSSSTPSPPPRPQQHAPSGQNQRMNSEEGEESRGEGEPGGGREGERVMRLLANMTSNVMDAVAYFRHTGTMMERLMATTETMAAEQTRLRYDILESTGLLPPNEAGDYFDPMTPEHGDHSTNTSLPASDIEETDTSSPEEDLSKDATTGFFTGYAAAKSSSVQSKIPKARSASPNTFRRPVQYFHSGGTSHPSSEESLRVLAELAKNGTQLLDVLTDLAQLSSTSLTKAVGSLHEEVVRLEDVRARLNEGLLFPDKGSASSPKMGHGGVGMSSGGDLAGLQNTTKTIFTIVEAIASNTGWIPYIFHNMQQVERLTNRTLELAKRSLLSMHWSRGAGGGNLSHLHPQRRPTLSGQPSVSETDALEVIYDTNVQMLRLIPALTRLLAEPEPLIALAGGGSSKEGRVEAFYQGRWGSVCSQAMGHNEAAAICRHLGHTGGIWAGDQKFGRGTERYWRLNASCLETHLCSFLVHPNDSVQCDEGHFSVVCDHMLRLTAVTEGETSTDSGTGLMSMHHKGRWLPICGHGWSGYEARVACQQMGFEDGRELDQESVTEWTQIMGNVTEWVSGVSCSGEETALASCKVDSFQANTCFGDAPPAGVRCQ